MVLNTINLCFKLSLIIVIHVKTIVSNMFKIVFKIKLCLKLILNKFNQLLLKFNKFNLKKIKKKRSIVSIQLEY